jgi:hypothetical protein
VVDSSGTPPHALSAKSEATGNTPSQLGPTALIPDLDDESDALDEKALDDIT